METLKIIEQKENPLLKRKEIIVELESEITPKKVDVEKIISEKFSSDVENIKLRKIQGRFGSKVFTILVDIYASIQDKENILGKPKQEKSEKSK
jgi:ribosomal protein S24E